MVTIVSEDVDIATKIVIDWFLNKKKEFKVLKSTLFNSVYKRVNRNTDDTDLHKKNCKTNSIYYKKKL